MNRESMSQLKQLLQWTQSKWQGIHHRLESFFIENRTNPQIINFQLKLGYPHATRNPFYEYAKVGAIEEQTPISKEDFDRLLNVAKEISTNYKTLVDSCYPITSNSYERPNEHAQVSVIDEVDDISTIDTKVIKLQNLPIDVRGSELVDVVMKLLPRITYLLPADIIIENDNKNIGCKQAYISLKFKGDSLDVYNSLKGQVFGQKVMQVNFSIGHPNECIWIGNIKSSSEITEKSIRGLLEEYGSIKRVDIRSDPRNFFSFVEFDNIKSAFSAMNALRKGKNNGVIDLLGKAISIRFGSMKPDKPVEKHAVTDLRNTIRTRSRSRSRERGDPNRNRAAYFDRPGPDRARRDDRGHDNWGAPDDRFVPDNRNHNGFVPRENKGFRSNGFVPRENRGHDNWGAPDNRPGPDSRGYTDIGGAPRDNRGPNGNGNWVAPDNRPGPDFRNRNNHSGGNWGAPDNRAAPERPNFDSRNRNNNTGGNWGAPDNRAAPERPNFDSRNRNDNTGGNWGAPDNRAAPERPNFDSRNRNNNAGGNWVPGNRAAPDNQNGNNRW